MYNDVLDEAFKAMENAYAPYSNYHVGAYVKLKNGTYRSEQVVIYE